MITRMSIVSVVSLSLACQRPTADPTDVGSEESGSTSTDDHAGTTSTGESDAESSSSGTLPRCDQTDHPVITLGSAVTVDGQVSDGEWTDAAPFSIQPAEDWSADVGIKHDGDSLVFVFASFQPPSVPPAIVFPEVLIDVGNDKPETLGPDDWWFHVSATDCAAAGEVDNYDGCVPEAEGWEANNFAAGPIDLVEIRIELATLGLDPGQHELGLLLRLSDTQGFATHWPAQGDPLAPVTWSTVRLCP